MSILVRAMASISAELQKLSAEVVQCRACPRLVAWREQVAIDKRASFRNENYWAKPIPGFGDHKARLIIVGLAPAAHGGNRTGRIFTGDKSGDWLFRALYKAGYANQPHSTALDDGLMMKDAYLTAAVRCAPPFNKPTPEERDTCIPYLERELVLLDGAKVIVALGQFAFKAVTKIFRLRPQVFGHGTETELPDQKVLIGSYHPSQQNTFTGKLTEEMFDSIFSRAREIIG